MHLFRGSLESPNHKANPGQGFRVFSTGASASPKFLIREESQKAEPSTVDPKWVPANQATFKLNPSVISQPPSRSSPSKVRSHASEVGRTSVTREDSRPFVSPSNAPSPQVRVAWQQPKSQMNTIIQDVFSSHHDGKHVLPGELTWFNTRTPQTKSGQQSVEFSRLSAAQAAQGSSNANRPGSGFELFKKSTGQHLHAGQLPEK